MDIKKNLYRIYTSMEALKITDDLNENVLRYRLKGGASYIRDKRIKTFSPFRSLLTHPTQTVSSALA